MVMKLGGFGLVKDYDAILQAGFDYAEMDMAEVEALSDQQFGAFCSLVAETGFPIPTAIKPLPFVEPVLFLPDFREISLEGYLRSTCRKNAQIGLKTILFGNGKARCLVDEDSIGREDVFIRFLRMLCDIAGENGQEVLIEPLSPYYSNYINTLSEAARVIDRANMPNLFAMADLYHMVGVGEPLEDITRYRNLIRHVHVSDPLAFPARRYPLTHGGYDYAPFFEQLRDYHGMLTIEADVPDDWMRAGREGRAFLNAYSTV